MPISKRQLAFLHVGKSKLGLTDETFRLALAQIGGVTSSKDLDRDGFDAMIGFFEYLDFTPTGAKGKSYGTRPGMASFAQIELIRALWNEYTRFSYQGEGELNTWLEHYWKISSLRFLTAAQAPKVITALKAMKSRAS